MTSSVKFKDLSRLKPWHKSLLYKEMPPANEFKWQQNRQAQKCRYATHGAASGVQPGLMWPAVGAELQELRSRDDHFDPNLVDTLRQLIEERRAKQQSRDQLMRRVNENFKKYPEIVEQYVSKRQETLKAAEEAKIQRESRIKEVRASFGYAIHESDPRFKVKLQLKAEEEKMVNRLERKKEKQAKMLQKLQAMTASLAAHLPTDSREASSSPSSDNPPV